MSDDDTTAPAQLCPKVSVNKPRQEAKAKRWCFTINNWRESDLLDPSPEFSYVIQGREVAPTTQTKHLQCFVILSKDQRWTALHARYPDWQKLEKARKDPWTCYSYCSKEDPEPHEFGTRPKEPKGTPNADDTFSEALSVSSVEEGCRIIREGRPRDWCLHGEAIKRNLASSKVEPFKHHYSLKDFTAPELQLEKATLLVGDTQLGKTHFALAHFKNPLIVSVTDDLKKLSVDHDGVVFDDMSFTGWKTGSVIALLDWEIPRSIRVLYGTVKIPAYTKKIFTHNSRDIFYLPETDQSVKDAIDRRINIVNILNKIY